jgi:hypothetical protein
MVSEDKNVKPDQIEKRSATTEIVAAAVSGVTGGVAGVVAQQALGKLTGNDKPKEPKK